MNTRIVIIIIVVVVAAILVGLFSLRRRQEVVSTQPTATPTEEETPVVVVEEPTPTVEETPVVVEEPTSTPTVEKEEVSLPLEHQVVKGENLWRIAAYERYYNDPLKWVLIFAANTHQIFDPDLIFPDQILLIPLEAMPPLEFNPYKRVKEKWVAMREGKDNQHFVLWGESLWRIAGEKGYYGDSSRWSEILKANRPTIADPNKIFPKQILLILDDIGHAAK